MDELVRSYGKARSDLLRELLVPSDDLIADVNDSNGIMRTSLHCLALLGDVMTLCLPLSEEEDSLVPPSQSTREKEKSRLTDWTHLLDQLWKWHSSRPTEVQALIEIDDHEATFPTILFTSSAGIFVNMTYHAAMLLLLDHWPSNNLLVPFSSKAGVVETQVSPLWHARRVCGIALNSDPEHSKCWDPCMIAEFALAARLTPNPNQRNELLVCLDKVRMAGWRVDGLVRRLREEWS
ncbi:uncharacterized protein A1O9_01209 [Exophiala aquamarina CBS 119918]|uniref:Uncharacterized protein n=1 Tax=Exophiala aquamarina CBS 119918 TaxID=1182545 RepID=A0A072PU17_9EURO|nr:uncharacterized protein A1O9_01209 [Exophiala aquamarina CBS 119918]KEF63232.1 hypothetical protein A1O9_01209 [Exophiala aquamarina CBS 119918]